MINEIERAREIFLAPDVDEETRNENAQKIAEWEQTITQNSAYADWKELDITRQINKKARETYVQLGVILAQNRSLTHEQRVSLYAQQDACIFILNLTDRDAKTVLNDVLREIRQTLNATS